MHARDQNRVILVFHRRSVLRFGSRPVRTKSERHFCCARAFRFDKIVVVRHCRGIWFKAVFSGEVSLFRLVLLDHRPEILASVEFVVSPPSDPTERHRK